MNQYIENINNGREVRESLASLCGLLRTQGEKTLSVGDAEALIVLAGQQLKAEDPKVRKNAAKLLGLMSDTSEETVDLLVEAYSNEQTRFVKSTYLEALNGKNFTKHIPFLRKCLKELLDTTVTEENRKHINEEVAALTKLPGLTETKRERFYFNGYDLDNTVLFVVNPSYREMFADSIGAVRKKIVNGGVVVRTTEISDILSDRIWREAVFRVPEALTVPQDPYEAAAVLSGDIIKKYIAIRLECEGTLRYRIDFRCRDEELKKRFVKRIAQETDRLSGGRLLNDPGDYEVTFRISETNLSTYRLGILFTGLHDNRFSYRKETVAGSIHPTDAAAVMAFAKPYLIEDAQVLDPFCGAGTMIAERLRAGKIRTAFGVDTFGPAIEKARINVKSSNVWFVHRDFYDYRQDHMFDEIITNMPFREDGDTTEIAVLYRRFFRKLPEHLRRNGTLVMVSHDPKLAESSIPNDMTVVKKLVMRERGEMAAYIIRFRELA